jgi:hypothetical protein
MVENRKMPMKKPNTLQVTKLRSSASARSKNGFRAVSVCTMKT